MGDEHPWHQFIGDRDVLTSPEQFPRTVRHLASRGTFTLCMLEHPRIVTTGNRCFARGPIDATMALWNAAEACWTFADRLGLDEVAEALPPGTTADDRARFEILLDNHDAAHTRYLDELVLWHKSLVRAIRQTLTKHFSTCAAPGCHGHLWPWLLQDLAAALTVLWLDLVIGADDSSEAPVLDYKIDPAPSRVALEVPRGESAAAIAVKVRAQMRTSGAAVGVVPWKKLESGDYGRYAQWYYRHHVLGDTIGAIARDYHDSTPDHTGRLAGRRAGRTKPERSKQVDTCDDRPTIRYGIRQASQDLEGGENSSGK